MIASKTTETPTCFCLRCGAEISAATDPGGDDSPSAGAISVCLYCGAVTVFADDLTLRPLTPVEAQEILDDTDLLERLATIQGARFFLAEAAERHP